MTAKGTITSSEGKKLKLKLNLTPRILLDDPKKLVMVGKNVDPLTLKQLN